RTRGQHAPTRELESLATDLLRERIPGGDGRGRVGVEEDDAGGEFLPEPDSCLARYRTQEAFGLLQRDPAPIACLAVGGNGAAMRQRLGGGDRGLYEPMARLIVELRQQAEAAARPLVGLLEESPCRPFVAHDLTLADSPRRSP